MLNQLKQQVYEANRELVRAHLVILTWGNVSSIDREQGLVVIKPSGVAYQTMQPADMVVVDLKGNIVEGNLRPSSDLKTHLELYHAWPQIGAVVHTHSSYATMFAQADQEIPCFGTTHADYFYGSVPLSRALTAEEVKEDYEKNTGKVIIERFAKLDPVAMPGILVANHAPFVWGKNNDEAVKNAIILEEVAKMAWGTLQLNPQTKTIPQYILDKHYYRKHGTNAYYGQKGQ